MDMDRRAVLKSAAVGAAITGPKIANAWECSPAEIDPETGACPVPKNDIDRPKLTLAPIIQIMDHRGCSRPRTEYKGKPSNDANDQMCVTVRMENIDDFYKVAMIPRYKQGRQAMYGWKYQDLLYTGYNGKFKPARQGDAGYDPNDPTPWRPKSKVMREKIENAYKEKGVVGSPQAGGKTGTWDKAFGDEGGPA